MFQKSLKKTKKKSENLTTIGHLKTYHQARLESLEHTLLNEVPSILRKTIVP